MEKLFVDETFPPNPRSLYESSESILEDQALKIFQERAKQEAIVWKRPSEFLDGPFSLFQENIEPNDIKQVLF